MAGSVTRQNVCHGAGAERGRRLLLLVADLLQHGRDLARHERQRHEERGDDDAGDGEDDLDAVRRRARARTSPCGRRRSSSDRPTTTGEIANGRSISASSSRLPGKRPRTSAIAASTPKMALSGTVMAATSSVRNSAWIAAGVVIDSQNAPSPFSNVR